MLLSGIYEQVEHYVIINLYGKHIYLFTQNSELIPYCPTEVSTAV